MRALSLFSGIGGIDLAAEWAGIEVAAMCEIEPFAQKVLKKHWPNIPLFPDIRKLNKELLEQKGVIKQGGTIELIYGGFPCQPFSVAGKQKGKEDNRYLWPEMLRVIRELTPRWVIGENVPGILRIAGKEVCEDLEREGYAVTIFNFEAAAVGAKHRRERFFFVGHSKHHGHLAEQKLRSYETPSHEWWKKEQEKAGESQRASRPIDVSSVCGREHRSEQNEEDSRRALRQGAIISGTDENEIRKRDADFTQRPSGSSSVNVANTTSERWEKSRDETRNTSEGKTKWESWAADGVNGHIWESEPNVGRVANGIPNRVDRLRGLGNAVVPQQIYPILKAIVDIEEGKIREEE